MTDTMPSLGLPPVDDSEPGPDDRRYWSVTSILKTLASEALNWWNVNQVAQAACKAAGSLQQRLDEDGEEATVKWLMDARWRRPSNQLSAASLGSAAHTAFERFALSGCRPTVEDLAGLVEAQAPKMSRRAITAEATVLSTLLDRLAEWFDVWQPEYTATEVVVYWARNLRDRSRAAGIAFFAKQDSGVRTEMNIDFLGEVIEEWPRPHPNETPVVL